MNELALKYGCNPNQKPSRIYMEDGSDLPVTVLNGKPGYINFLDALNSIQLVKELKAACGLPAAASFKHVSPAGAALGLPLTDVERRMYHIAPDFELSPLACAYARARGADRMSSFGDWIALSDVCDVPTAKLIQHEVSDGIIAPGYEPEALTILAGKKKGNYNVVAIDPDYKPAPVEHKQVYGITFEQGRNELTINADTMLTNWVTENKSVTEEQKRDLIMRFETALALISKSQTELRDVEANYNKFTLKQFEADYPNIHLQQLCAAQGIQSQYIQEMIVGQPAFLAGLDKLLATQTADELRAYMEWDVINQAANYLSDDVRAVSFGFYSQTMRGAKEDQPRWKRATSQVEGMMGEALGRIYCEKYFPASSKKRMEELIGNLQVALTERIKAQTWMSEPTKKNALDKLAAFYVKVGYPNTWKDLSALTIDPQKSYYENMLSCVTFWSNEAIEKKAGKPVDRDEWHMTPQTVNAYYNPTTNEICFPAGILQYPFFDPKADDAFNYGAIGVVIGHEMLHGFDDQGRHYDKDGNMHDWWTESDTKSFNERAEQYADFFSNIKVLPDLNANGHFTLGENLADHGGLQVSFYALKHATEGKKQKKLLGFTPEQRFFIAYSGVWAANITEKEIRSRTKSDPHALGEWRVNGALPHIDMWYDAFGVKPGDKMYLPKNERLELW